MELLGTVLSAARTLNSALSHLKDGYSLFSYESQMDDLIRTVESLTAVLRDAETKQQLSEQARVYILHIKDAIFEADDLMDELLTQAQHQRIVDADASRSLRGKVSHFFSKANPIYVSYWMSRGVKDVKNKLDAIAYNNQFSFKIDPQPIRKRSRETCSYVDEVGIIGRQHDLESIVGKLLASDDQNSNNVSVLSIVGIGGLGKTALAQLVYNDPRVTNAFPLKMWTCVSDEDQKVLNVKDILVKILDGNQHDLTLQQVQSKLRSQLADTKYLLVLDDVWTENRHQWCKLAEYLLGGKRGSYIVITTRSQKTATITGGLLYGLSGLSKENSWHLFEKTAFTLEQLNPPREELVRIGEKIVRDCVGVPLAIRVAGSLLYGQDKNKWMNVQEIGLSNIRDADNGIVPILELSFHHLESQLKNCFCYCSMFPKDYEIKKEVLVRLWIAQGYVVPLDIGQSIDDAVEEYFSILLKRCFFQNIKKNKDGEIESCKIHDLMHDIAQKVSGKETYALNTTSGRIDNNVRHLSILCRSQFEKYCSMDNSHIRSLVSLNNEYYLPMDGSVKKFKRLRALGVSATNSNPLLHSIGDLLHLRYIDLSRNYETEALPNSITKLCNLQFLILYNCKNLKELPKDLSRLIKLKVLDIECCYNLKCMPRGMGKLTSLHTLKGHYLVGGEERCKSWKQWLDGLEDLKSLINLKGKLEMKIIWPDEDAKKDDIEEDQLREALYLRSLEHLNHLVLYFKRRTRGMEDEGMRRRMRVMEAMQPHSNIKMLKVRRYDGVKMPDWLTLLPNLVELKLEQCYVLKYLPWLGNSCHLKSLRLKCLSELEYMIIEEESREVASTSSSTAQKVTLYPSLECLKFEKLRKFRGWRRGVESEETSSNNNSSSSSRDSMIIPQLSLPQLKSLEIWDCRELTSSSFLCHMLETLYLDKFSEGMRIEWTKTDDDDDEKSSEEPAINNPEGSTHHNVPNLRELEVSKGAWLDSVPVESFHSLRELRIFDDDEMVELPNNLQYFSALQTLEIDSCKSLKAMPTWMPKHTSLEHLHVKSCSESLHSRCKRDPPGEDWPLIQHIPNIGFSPFA